MAEETLDYINAAFISKWLVESARKIEEMQDWWLDGCNAVTFTTAWLDFNSAAKRSKLMAAAFENALVDLEAAFAVGKSSGNVTDEQVDKVLRLCMHEYPLQFDDPNQGAVTVLERSVIVVVVVGGGGGVYISHTRTVARALFFGLLYYLADSVS